MVPALFHLSHTGPLAGVRLCGAERADGPAIHAGYHNGVAADRICPACLAEWDAAGDAEPGAIAEDESALAYRLLAAAESSAEEAAEYDDYHRRS